MQLEPRSAVGFSKITERAQLSIGVVRSLLAPYLPTLDEDDVVSVNEGTTESDTPDLAIRKLHEDLEYLEGMLCGLSRELATSCTFRQLEKCVALEQEDQRKKSEFIALFQGQKWKARHMQKSNRLQGLQQDLESVSHDTQHLIQEKDQEIAELLSAIEEARRLNPQREQYERRTAEVQVENLHFHMEQEERKVCADIARVGREVPQELRVHDALISFLKEACARLETQITDWEEKFTQDTSDKAEEVAKWEEEVRNRRRELEEVAEKCEEYWGVVEKYRAEKEEEERQQTEEKRQHKAAAKIQAWWRGYTVRRGMSALRKKIKKAKTGKK
ncbi:hypothetical protein Pcinc_021638 [Petrolisthes cinctipes]|uniref:Dynein regulatory complex protein 9 n=1 Tax=Petrolisthes cinctipes TaxID=88211 RepID=A0AAE1FH90_PETCI|nr:hypothetical protein Pcinc_021638 [Petrolisthes cinctipes]